MKHIIFILLLVLAGLGCARAADESGLRQDDTPLTVWIDGRSWALEAFTARPAQGDHFPVVLFVHGSARSNGELRDLDLSSDRQWARTMASRGWLAVSVARRGYGKSEGSAFLSIGTCEEPAVAAYLDHHAIDIEAALRAIGERSDADMSRVLLIGKSVGGAVALDVAARGNIPISAVVNVSGGVSAYTKQLAINPDCGLMSADVVWNFARFGAAARDVPTLWLYAENDPWFSPAFVGRLHTAYTAADGQAELAMLPAFAPNGHDLYHDYDGQQQMLPRIDAFLAEHGLPTWDPGFGDRLLSRLKPEQRALGLLYLSRAPAQKALAVADGESTVAWTASDSDSVTRAEDRALARCEANSHRACHLVAVNFGLVGSATAQTATR